MWFLIWFDLIWLGNQYIQITIKTHNNEIHLHGRYNKSTKDSPKSLLKQKFHSIGVLNIGTQCQSKDRDKIKTETSSEKNTKTGWETAQNSMHDGRPAQKSMQLWLATCFLINFLNSLKSWISLISFGKEFQEKIKKIKNKGIIIIIQI